MQFYPCYTHITNHVAFLLMNAGAICHTPYGDMTDQLLSDVSVAIMKRYSLLVAVSDMSLVGDAYLDRVHEYLLFGGTYAATGHHARQLFSRLVHW